jgi:hemolysin D
VYDPTVGRFLSVDPIVRDGQPATIKIDSFPFTRYGVIDGKVTAVSDDAMQDERLGLVYAAHVHRPG